MTIKTAFVHVTNKKDLNNLGTFLNDQNIEITTITNDVSKYLKRQGIAPISINENQLISLAIGDLSEFDLLVLNIPDAEKEIASDALTDDILANVVTLTHSLMRQAATQYKKVVILTDPEDYDRFMNLYERDGDISVQERLKFAQKVFAITSKYDDMIARYLYLRMVV